MTALAALSIDLIAKVATFEKDMQRTVKIVEGSAGQMTRAFNLVKTGVGGLAAAFSVGIAVEFVRSTVNSVDALNDLKDATGASIETLSALEDIALRNGNSVESMASSVVKFNKVLSEAKPGSEMEKALAGIGLNAQELRKMDPAEALHKTAKALAGYADNGDKARYIQALFGKSIREAGPWLKDLAEAGSLNTKVTTEQAEQAERFNKEMARLSKNTLDASRSLVSNYLPALNSILEAYRTGGLVAGTNELGNRLFDWEGSQQRKGIRTLEKDLKALRSEANGGGAAFGGVFLPRAQLDAEIKATEDALAAAKRAYFKLTDLQGGRGVVNPALVDGRASVPVLPGTTPGATKAERTDPNAQALAQYVKGLEQATERSLQLTEVEKARIFLTTLGTTGEVAQVQELVMGMATRIDQEKELGDLLKMRRAAATAAGDAVAAENEWLESLRKATPTAQLEAQRGQMQKLADLFSEGVFGDPASIKAAETYGEVVRVQLGIASEATQKLDGDFASLGATFSSSLEDAIVKGGSLREVVQGLAEDVLRIGVRKTVTEPLGNAVSSMFKGFSIGSLFGFADGGVMTGAGPMPLRAYASGGVASSPQVALYGEGSMNEAFVPLPDGRRIPVALSGGGGRAVVIHINNTIGSVASQSDVVQGMRTVRAQIIGELSRGQRMGGSLA